MLNLLAIPTYFTLGSINVALVDIIVLVCLLIATIVGIVRGFVKQILAYLGIIAAVLLAVLFCDEATAFLCEKIPAFPTAIENWLGNTQMFKTLTGTFTSKEQIITALAGSSIPAFLHNVIAEAIVSSGFELQILSVFSKWLIYVIVFVVIIIASLILFAILRKLFSRLTRIAFIGFLDKLLGVVFSVALTLVVLMLICVIISPFTGINAFLQPEPVKCYFNEALTWVTSQPFIQDLIASKI